MVWRTLSAHKICLGRQGKIIGWELSKPGIGGFKDDLSFLPTSSNTIPGTFLVHLTKMGRLMEWFMLRQVVSSIVVDWASSTSSHFSMAMMTSSLSCFTPSSTCCPHPRLTAVRFSLGLFSILLNALPKEGLQFDLASYPTWFSSAWIDVWTLLSTVPSSSSRLFTLTNLASVLIINFARTSSVVYFLLCCCWG